ncbi:MAG: DNA polymerase III subunit beta [Oscillospiraceae bacterium]|jgi:DNA polymerase-3 subunit beta|nr:DNA polymerase III subunit beta [Oscillospiraceae bacterium]
MRINCDRLSLTEAVTNVMKAVSGKTSAVNPVLEGILLSADNGAVKLTAYDLKLGISTSTEAEVEEAGTVVVPANYFYSIIRKMPEDRIIISSDIKDRITLESGLSIFNILGLPAGDFPELPQVETGSAFAADRTLIKDMIDMTHYAIAQNDETRPVQTGALFEAKDGVLYVVAVDGFRLALRREKLESGQDEFKFIVPGKTLSELSRLIEYTGKQDSAENARLEIKFSTKHAVFALDEYTVFTRLLEGEFLDYSHTIPAGAQTVVTADTQGLSDSIDRVSTLITERLKSPLRCLFENNSLKISCVTANGRSYDEVNCAIDGSIVDIGFNSRFLLDALKASGEKEIRLEINGPLSPMKVLPKAGDKFVFLVLPMRLKNEA